MLLVAGVLRCLCVALRWLCSGSTTFQLIIEGRVSRQPSLLHPHSSHAVVYDEARERERERARQPKVTTFVVLQRHETDVEHCPTIGGALQRKTNTLHDGPSTSFSFSNCPYLTVLVLNGARTEPFLNWTEWGKKSRGTYSIPV